MNLAQLQSLRSAIIEAGFGDEITWAENIQPPADALAFWCEFSWVVLNSGMKFQVAKGIWERVLAARKDGQSASTVFRHVGKAAAIDQVWTEREDRFFLFTITAQDDILEELQRLPWIGPITRYHLAKNLGVDCCKPDRHLVRIAAASGETAEVMCARLSKESGMRVRVVDSIIWRSANLGLVWPLLNHGR